MRNDFDAPAPQSESGFWSGPSFELDPAQYSHHMADFDMTEEQKLELMQALWSIMRSFVEMGLDPKNCGQLATGILLASAQPQGIVESFANHAGKSGSE